MAPEGKRVEATFGAGRRATARIGAPSPLPAGETLTMDRTLALALSLSLASPWGCSPATPSTPAGDAAVDVARDVVAPDAPARDAPTADAPLADQPPAGDSSTCADLGGAWALNSDCSSIGLGGLEGTACLQQTGCGVRVSLSEYVGDGTVTGDTLSFPYEEMGVRYLCTGTIADGQLTVQCNRASGSLRCMFTASRATLEGASRLCCDLSAQDCGAGRRCSIVTLAGNAQTTGCVPAGALAEGATCTLRDGRVGFDDCGGITQCSSHAMPTGTRACRRPCARDADCAAGDVCLLIPSTPAAGLCRRRCTLFGSDCPADTTCRFEASRRSALASPDLVAVCSRVGGATAGQACTLPPDCAAGMVCSRAGGGAACAAMCDRTHPCEGGAPCNESVGESPEGRGVCQ